MIGKRKPLYYIQSKPPEHGVFIHHSHYTGLRGIANAHGQLRESKRYRGISLTTDPGRFLSPLPVFGTMVDGFIEFEAAPLIAENLIVPCLYQTTNPGLVKQAKKHGHAVFRDKDLPPEYKYILRFVCHNDMFVNENEHLFLGESLFTPDGYKLYVSKQFHKRLLKATTGPKDKIFLLDEHPLLGAVPKA